MITIVTINNIDMDQNRSYNGIEGEEAKDNGMII